jgi:hypothetical protein
MILASGPRLILDHEPDRPVRPDGRSRRAQRPLARLRSGAKFSIGKPSTEPWLVSSKTLDEPVEPPGLFNRISVRQRLHNPMWLKAFYSGIVAFKAAFGSEFRSETFHAGRGWYVPSARPSLRLIRAVAGLARTSPASVIHDYGLSLTQLSRRPTRRFCRRLRNLSQFLPKRSFLSWNIPGKKILADLDVVSTSGTELSQSSSDGDLASLYAAIGEFSELTRRIRSGVHDSSN